MPTQTAVGMALGMRELFPRYFFLVTNRREEQRGGWELLEHYRKRGTFEDRLGEFNGAIDAGLSAGVSRSQRNGRPGG